MDTATNFCRFLFLSIRCVSNKKEIKLDRKLNSTDFWVENAHRKTMDSRKIQHIFLSGWMIFLLLHFALGRPHENIDQPGIIVSF